MCDKQHCHVLIFAYKVTNVEGSHDVISEHLVVSLLCYDSLHLLLSCLHCPLSSATQKRWCVYSATCRRAQHCQEDFSGLYTLCLPCRGSHWILHGCNSVLRSIFCCRSYKSLIITTSFPFCLLSLADEGSQPSVGPL